MCVGFEVCDLDLQREGELLVAVRELDALQDVREGVRECLRQCVN